MFRSAGDDVDVCWRLQDRGHRIGFSPAAMVWHFRRNTVRAYIGQQRATARPRRCCTSGTRTGSTASATRAGAGASTAASPRSCRFAGPSSTAGVFGRGLFQTLYQPPAGLLAHLPFTLEWNAAALGCSLAWALVAGRDRVARRAPPAVTWGSACRRAAGRGSIRAPTACGGRLLIALLTYLGPAGPRASSATVVGARAVRGGARRSPATARALPVSWRERACHGSFWTEARPREGGILHALHEALAARRYFVRVDQGWSDWDLEVHGGVWSRARVTVVTENHGGDRRVLRVRARASEASLARRAR